MLLIITKQVNANVIDTVDRIKQLLGELKDWIPADLNISVVADRTATIRARSDSELLELSREGFADLFKSHPDTAAKMGEIIALRMSERGELLAAANLRDNSRGHARWLLAKISSVFNISPDR